MNIPDSKKCILCIDDDKAMHALLESQLVVSGYHSLHAMSGKEALKHLSQNQVDLILLDISMPNMDGFQILETLKTDQKTQNIPVVFLSSLSRENLKVKGLERGADDFIVKPFTGPELIARIKAILRRNEPMRQIIGDVQGKLQDLGLFELLHMLSFSSKSAVITFPEMSGELIVADGFVLSVRQGSRSGKEALLRLCFLEKGSFSIIYEKREGEEVGGIEQLLLFVASALDEIHDQFNAIAPKESKLHLNWEQGDLPEIETIRDLFPISFIKLIFTMKNDLGENLKVIKKYVKQGKITIETV